MACESFPQGDAWFKDGACVAFSEEEIQVKVACTSMFQTFTVAGKINEDLQCPSSSALVKCYCEAGKAERTNETCHSQVGIPQALCLSGDTQWLLQNAESIGFVDYCGWWRYQRPPALPDASYRNDSDCRHVILDPIGTAGCSREECKTLDDCISRCDFCDNCTAVLQQSSTAVRCHMQHDIHFENVRSEPFETGFFVNERNSGCTGQRDPLARGITAVKLYSDLSCEEELKPQQLFVMDSIGLTPLAPGLAFFPSCSARRCDPGGVSVVARFAAPRVVRCVMVQASGQWARGWRLSKSSDPTGDAGLEDFIETTWREVARSASGMGVRATWDGLMEVEADLRSSLSSWDDERPGQSSAVLPLVVALLVFFMIMSFLLWLRYFRWQSETTETRAPPIVAVLLPSEASFTDGAVSLEEINFDEASTTELRVSYVTSQELSQLQSLLDFTYRSVVTEERSCTKSCGAPAPCACVQPGSAGFPVAFRALNALRFSGASRRSAYAKRRREVQRKRDAMKVLELSSHLAQAKYPELKEVLGSLEPSSNEVYLWYGTTIRKALNIAKELEGRGGQTAGSFLRFAESCTKADEHSDQLMSDEPEEYYDRVYAMILCRVCLGRCYYSTDCVEATGTSATRAFDAEFDSVLLDRFGDGCREFLVCPAQVLPELLVFYSRLHDGEESELGVSEMPFLEVPIYWSNLHRSLNEPGFRRQLRVSAKLQEVLQRLVDASATNRHIVYRSRRFEDSRLWRRYARTRRSQRCAAGLSARRQSLRTLEDPAFDLHYDELLLWYLCADHEEAAEACEGSFLSSPRRRRAGIRLSEHLPGGMEKHHQLIVLLCRASCSDVHHSDQSADLAAVQSARTAGKDAVVASAREGRRDFVFFQEDQIYPEFLLELKDTE